MIRTTSSTTPIALLQQALDREASAKSREWWTRYMKGVIEFRGVGIPRIREVLEGWRRESGVSDLSIDEQFDLSLRLLRQPIAEDKLAGIVYLQQYLVDQVSWQDAVPSYAALFDDGSIYDWNICDWFCVRVLGPTIAESGMPAAREVSAWHRAENLWRARASAVAFVNLLRDSRYHPLVERSCAVLIGREERFTKTAVGWVMRELSRVDADRAATFIDRHREAFSREALRNATKYLDA